MAYKTIGNDDQDDTLVSFLVATERDHHSHMINKQRYETMLTTLLEGPFKDRIEGLLRDTDSRLEEVNAILTATEPQLPTATKITASIARLKAKGSM